MADILPNGICPLGIGRPTYMTIQGIQVTMPVERTFAVVGGIGFQLQGGVITIDATSPNINVSFDRPMAYNGDHSHVPSGTPYDIGTPSLALDARSIDIPITVPAQVISPTLVSYATPTSITLDWAEAITVFSTNNWLVTTLTGSPVSILNFDFSNPLQQVLTLSEHTEGAAYTLTIPAYCMSSSSGKLNTGLSLAWEHLRLSMWQRQSILLRSSSLSASPLRASQLLRRLTTAYLACKFVRY
jgi:hypothetical protein